MELEIVPVWVLGSGMVSRVDVEFELWVSEKASMRWMVLRYGECGWVWSKMG
jgi:hypothetical protein